MTKLLTSLLNTTAGYNASKPLQLDSNAPVFIYGTGTFACDAMHIFRKRGIEIEGFLNHREQERHQIENLKIYQSHEIQPDKWNLVMTEK